MDIRKLLWNAAQANSRRAMPILAFPAAQKLGCTVDTLVKSAELQVKAMEIIACETDTVAAVSLMDLSVEAEAFGAKARFSENEVPAIIGQLISDENEANLLPIPELTAGRSMLCVEAICKAKRRITTKPVFAGMIGPYSLAGRLMDVTEIMYLCFDEPDAVHTVLKKGTQYLIQYGQALKDAGADGILLAEPLAGILSPSMAVEFSIRYVKQIIQALQDDHFSVIYHNCGDSVPQMLDAIYEQGAAAYHFGNSVDMAQILSNTPADILVMGNIDPAGQFASGTEESIRAATLDLLEKCRNYPNFIISSGCDIPAHAPWKNILAFFDAVNNWSR